jgi:hypothetical protein
MEFLNGLCQHIPEITHMKISDIGYDPHTSCFRILTEPFMARCRISNSLEIEVTFYVREIQRRLSALSGIGFRTYTPQFGDLTPFLIMETGAVLHLQPDILRYVLIDNIVEICVIPTVMTEGAATFLEWVAVFARVCKRQ